MDLDPHFHTNFCKAFAKPLGVWDHSVNVSVAVIAEWVVVVGVLDLVNTVSSCYWFEVYL